MKFLSRARGISVKATFCYGFYTFVGIAIIHSVYVKCSDDGAAADLRLELNNTGRSNEAITDFFEPVGCFKDKPLRALPKPLKTFSVDWGNMNSSLATIIHECAEMVNKQYGFQYFALQSWKECWSGVNGSLTYNKHGKASNCYEFGEYGVGKSWSNFVYRFTKVDGMWSHWSPWQACTVTCGVGYKTRTRTCTNPAPKWSGQDCIGMHISSNNCNLEKCKETTVIDSFEPVGCFKDKKDPRAFPILIKSFSKLVNWNNITSSLMAVIRACAEVVQKNYFRYFGVQFYKECWTGVNGSMTYNRHGKSFSCLGVVHGVGKDWTNFVYRFVKVNGKWGNWSPWQPCSVTCGLGNRTRVRACTDPAPKWEGKDCVGLSIASENCSLHECKEPTSSAKSSLLAPVLGSSCLMFLCLVGAIFLGLRCLRRRRSNSELPDQWEVVFDDISLCKIIGEGAFGKVYSGEFQKKTDATKSRKITTRRRKEETKEKKNSLKVAVKMLRNGATDEQRQEFLEEIELMKQIGYHRHILNLLACCTTTVPMFLVVEFAKYGDLLNYLRQRREQIKQAAEEVKDDTNGCIGYQNMQMIDETNLYDVICRRSCASNTNKCTVTSHRTSQNTSGHHNDLGIDTDGLHDEDKLTPADLLTFAWQIAKGMEFLSRKGFVHRDLAARNVLVCEGKLIKVADFGLSRYIYTEKVYHCKKSRKLPIKWMSPEAIYDQVFTAESDVWAYGILLWEMGTIGGTPYPAIANQRLLQALKSGYRMEKPQICTDELYELMRQCWQEKPDERPSFTFIREQLEQMMLRHCSYLDLSNANQYCHAPCCDSESDEKNTSL